MSKPSIGVIIVAHKRQEFIHRAVESVITQRIKAEKVVVVKSFMESQLDLELKKNGVINLFTELISEGDKILEALRELSTEVVCFLEDDDYFSPGKIEWVQEVFQEDVTFFHNGFVSIDDQQKILTPEETSNLKVIDEEMKIPKTLDLNRIRFLQDIGFSFNLSSISIRSDIIKGNYLKGVSTGIDNILFVKSIEKGTVIHQPDPLTIYRYHHPTSSSPSEEADNYIKWIHLYLNSLKNFKGNNTTQLANKWASAMIRRLERKLLISRIGKLVK
ncbi:Glycosyl transferase family 2 [Thermoplasmatales archaeon]|nr:Glycosyl transferase family 2 [Thermoplasmatales archaeon]